MNDDHSCASPRRLSWIDRAQALFEVLLLSGLVSGFLATLPFTLHAKGQDLLLQEDVRMISLYLLLDAAITFVLLALVMRAHRESVRSIGITWERWKPRVALGIGLVPFLFIVNALAALFFKTYLPQHFMEENPLTRMIRTPEQLALFILSVLIAGGIREELQRAFILNRFRSHLGGAITGLILWSLAFGAGHYVQQGQGMVIASLYGLVFGVIYLVSGSLTTPIAAHSVYDVVALLAYWHSR